MKKFYAIVCFIVLLFMASCEQEEPEIIIEECLENQIEVDEECITLTGPELQLYNTLANMESIDNYQLDVAITELDSVQLVTLNITDGLSTYEDANETIYYVNDDGTCRTIIETLGHVTTENVPCATSNSVYSFFHSFDYTWFALESGVYALQTSNFNEVEPFFSTMITDCSLTKLTMQVANNEIQSIHVELMIGEDPIELDFTISSIGSVVITLPVE